MSKVSRLRGARSSIAPYVMSVIGLAAVCTDGVTRDLRIDAAVSARDAGAGEGGGDARQAEPVAGRHRAPVSQR